jgi:hypothetical protein
MIWVRGVSVNGFGQTIRDVRYAQTRAKGDSLCCFVKRISPTFSLDKLPTTMIKSYARVVERPAQVF